MTKKLQSAGIPQELLDRFEWHTGPPAKEGGQSSSTKKPQRGKKDPSPKFDFDKFLKDESEIPDLNKNGVPIVRKTFYDNRITRKPVQDLCKVLGSYQPEKRYLSVRSRYLTKESLKKRDYLDQTWIARGKNILLKLYPWPPSKIFYSWGYYKYKNKPTVVNPVQKPIRESEKIYKEMMEVIEKNKTEVDPNADKKKHKTFVTEEIIEQKDEAKIKKRRHKRRNTYVEEYVMVEDDTEVTKKKKHKKGPHYVVTEEVIWVDDDLPVDNVKKKKKKKRRKTNRIANVTEEIIEIPYATDNESSSTLQPKKLKKKKDPLLSVTQEVIELPTVSETKMPKKKKTKKDPITTVTEEIIEIPYDTVTESTSTLQPKKRKTKKDPLITVTKEVIELPSDSETKPSKKKKTKKDPITTVKEEIIEIPYDTDTESTKELPTISKTSKKKKIKKNPNKKQIKGPNVTVTKEIIEIPSTSNNDDEASRPKKKNKTLASPSTTEMVFTSFEDDPKKEGKKNKKWF